MSGSNLPYMRVYEYCPNLIVTGALLAEQGADISQLPIKTLDSQNLKLRCRLDNGRHDFEAVNMDLLPIPYELMEFIIKHLDIVSLTTFRRVSKQARYMVDSTFEYKQIMNRAPQIIRGALALKAGSFSLNDAYITLQAQHCTTCERRAGFIYMITCERVCFMCLLDAPRWKPRVGVEDRFRLYGAAYPDPDRVPSVWARPGRYGSIGGYERCNTSNTLPGFIDRKWKFHWVHKEFSSRFWDAKHCGCENNWEFMGWDETSWYASSFFVSVSAPLVKREAHEITHEDRLRQDRAILEAGIIVPREHDIAVWQTNGGPLISQPTSRT